MNFERYFTIVEGLGTGQKVKVVPSEYLEKLHPHKAIVELQAYVETLEERLIQYAQFFTVKDFETPKNVDKLVEALAKLKVTNIYLDYLVKSYKTIH